MCRFLSGNRINTILNDDLPKNLITLELRGNPLGDIQFDALQSMPRLRKLYVFILYGIFLMDPYIQYHINECKTTLPKPTGCMSRVLSDAKSLSELPSLEGCSSLEILRMDRANISVMPNTLCQNSSHLKSLYVKLNRLFSNARTLKVMYNFYLMFSIRIIFLFGFPSPITLYILQRIEIE